MQRWSAWRGITRILHQMPTAAMCRVPQRRDDRLIGVDERALINIVRTTSLIFMQFGDLQNALPLGQHISHSDEMRMK